MKILKTNMRLFKPSRKPLKEGDIFAFSVKEGEYYFGRVIKLNVIAGGFPGAILIYIYNSKSTNKNEIPALDKNNLLIPPEMINRLPWSRGYFEVVDHKILEESDCFSEHCFKLLTPNSYVNEFGAKVNQIYANVGFVGLNSYASIDDIISRALNIPLADDSK